MNESKKINLDEFFFNVSDEIYCIIKLKKEFPDYSRGDDIDIFCYNSISFSKKILKTGNNYVNNGYEIKVASFSDYDQSYIDFFYNDNLEFRFDLYGTLPHYKNIKIRPALFSSIIENAIPRKRTFEDQEYSIYVPNAIDEMVIRYIEYIEWYRQRPDKIKHLDYILNNSDDNVRITLLDKIHYYTELPPVEPSKTKRQKKIIRKILDFEPIGQIMRSKFAIKVIIPPLKFFKNRIWK